MSTLISKVGEYSGYHEPEYNSYVLHRCYIPMQDGVRLAASILVPACNGAETEKPLPVILNFTPYSFVKVQEDGSLSFSDNLGAMNLLSYGYVLAEVEVRGTGISFGTRQVVNSRQEAADGAEVVEWLAAQKFCDGKVGTIGWSYHGQTQLGILSQKPEHLVASVIGMTDFNRYDGWVRNGIPRAFGSQPDTVWETDPEKLEAQIREMAEKELPVPEDPDREQVRTAIRDHIANGLQIPVQRDLTWRDSEAEAYGGAVWKNCSASTYAEEIEASGTAIYLLGGLYDVFRRDTVLMYRNLRQAKKLTIGPWYHVGKKQSPEPWIEILRWMDFWLKGIENGITEEKPLSFCVGQFDFEHNCHDGADYSIWRFEEEWPLERRAAGTWYYMSDVKRPEAEGVEDGSMQLQQADASEVSCRAVYGIKTGVESRSTVEENGRGADQLGLTFSTSPLAEDTAFIGHPMVHLPFAMTDAGDWKKNADLDFFVTISDFDPETGKTFQFCDGHLRTSLRAVSEECPYDFGGLPWHRACRGDREYPKVGEEIGLVIDCMPIAYSVKKGHCIRLSIENSQDRMYYAGRFEYEADPDFRGPAYRIKVGGAEGLRVFFPNIYN